MSSYAIDDGERLLLFDPLGVPRRSRSACRPRDGDRAHSPWHERDSEGLVERHGMPVYTPLPDSAEYLMKTYGITAEQAGEGSPDLIWLLRESKGDARPYSAGDKLPVGVEVFPGQKPNDMVLWVESHRAVVAGDTLADFGDGPQINPRWLSKDVTREQVVDGLRPLLDCRLSTSSRRMEVRSTVPPSSARFPERDMSQGQSLGYRSAACSRPRHISSVVPSPHST